MSDPALRKLCNKSETLKHAQAILSLARQRTGQGSGFDLTSLSSHLPAFCAYIASERLQNSDVSYEAAMGAACQTKAIFNKAVDTIRQAIKGAEPPRRTRSNTGGYYTGLITQYKLTKIATNLEKAMNLMEDKALSLLEVKDAKAKHVRVAIFYWVCRLFKSKVAIDWDTLVANEQVSPERTKRVLDILDKKAQSIAVQIQEGMPSTAATLLPSTPRAVRTSPSKTPNRVPPTKQSPSKPPASPSKSTTKPPSQIPLSPSKTPSKRVPPTGDKRKEPPSPDLGSDDEDELLLRSPSKKAKLEVASPAKKRPEVLSVEDTPSKKRPSSGPLFGTVSLDRKIYETPTKNRTATSRPGPSALSRPLFTSTTPRRSPRMITEDSPVRQRVFVEGDEEVDDEEEEEEEQDVEEPLPRFRPVFLDRRQWTARDPRVDVLWKRAEENKRKLVEKFGNPFARQTSIAAT